jgi:hypothetical protein
MALGTCTRCGHQVSTSARACPKCGAPPPKLAYCTRCGGGMFDTESVCPTCGAHRYESSHAGSFAKHENPSTANRPTAVLPPRPTTEDATSQPRWQCPKCKSENIQKLSVIYSEGTTSSTQGVIGLELSRSGAVGVGGGVGGGTSSTVGRGRCTTNYSKTPRLGRQLCWHRLSNIRPSWFFGTVIFGRNRHGVERSLSKLVAGPTFLVGRGNFTFACFVGCRFCRARL